MQSHIYPQMPIIYIVKQTEKSLVPQLEISYDESTYKYDSASPAVPYKEIGHQPYWYN